ncbi:MAG: tol-pal system YbgF family protein [Bdellovibrionales bacterium]
MKIACLSELSTKGITVENINELELRKWLLKKPSSAELVRRVVRAILSAGTSWDEKRVLWLFLFQTGRDSTLANSIIQVLAHKGRIPYDALIEMCNRNRVRPTKIVIESVLKGVRKQEGVEELISATGWDKWDQRFSVMRRELLGRRVSSAVQMKETMLEKFQFLHNQRLTEQAGRVLRRMLDLFPEDNSLKKMKADFDEQWARDVLSNHIATLSNEKIERAVQEKSSSDEEMLASFLAAGEKIAMEHREFAADLAVGFLFMQDYMRSLEILPWASPTVANEWLRTELLVLARRFVEALDLLNQMEVRYANDPETAFAVSYMRAMCFRELGQKDAALEIMRSIARVRPNYRSAQALIQDWTGGMGWE